MVLIILRYTTREVWCTEDCCPQAPGQNLTFLQPKADCHFKVNCRVGLYCITDCSLGVLEREKPQKELPYHQEITVYKQCYIFVMLSKLGCKLFGALLNGAFPTPDNDMLIWSTSLSI